MDENLQKAFFIILVIVLLATVGTAIGTPIKNKINAQNTQITNLTFT